MLMRNVVGTSIAVVLLLVLPACGGSWSSGGAWSTAAAPNESRSTVAMVPMSETDSADLQESYHVAGVAGGDGTPEQRQRFAQADTSTSGEDDAPPTATDAHRGPLLVYTATIGLAVHQVADKQERIEVLAREAGGHLDRRTDSMIRIRVPAAQFQAVLDAILELGDVLHRDVQVQDVSEEFHDMQLRIRTLEAMYARVRRLLEDADDVGEALAVEQHLERITMELERLRGRLRFLADRLAFSTITINFQERTQVSEPTFELPFRWLRALGLQGLMRLR